MRVIYDRKNYMSKSETVEAGSEQLPCGIELIQQQIHDNSGYGNIEPDGENETRDLFMRFIQAFETTPERHDHQRCDDDRENSVRCENRKIDRPDEALARKFCRPKPEIISAQCVMGNVGDQKEGGDRTCRQHAKTVLRYSPFHDENKSGQ